MPTMVLKLFTGQGTGRMDKEATMLPPLGSIKSYLKAQQD